MDIQNEDVQVDQPTSEEIDPSKVQFDSQEEIPNEDVEVSDSQTENQDKYGSLGQQALAGLEGAGQGFAGPLATGAEMALNAAGVPGLAPEDIQGRAKANPWTHSISEAAGLGAGLVSGVGELAGASKVANAAAKTLGLGKIGSTALKGAIESGLIQGSDEISKAMLGQEGGNPAAAVASAMALGGILGVPLGIAAKAANTLAETKMAEGAAKKLGEFGARWTERQAPDFVVKAGPQTAGGELADKILGEMPNFANKAIRYGTDAIAAGVGGRTGGTLGAEGAAWLTDKYLSPTLSKWLGAPLTKLSTNSVSAAVKVLGEGDANALYKVLDYAKGIDKGAKAIDLGVGALFKPTRQLAIDQIIPDKDKKTLSDWIDKGGVNQDLQPKTEPLDSEPQGYAEGGPVGMQASQQPKNPVAEHFPAQDMLMNAAKGRVSQYLTSLKPNHNAPKLPFDKSLPTKNQDKSYDKALELAVKPLTILHDIKNGTLSVEKLKHFTQMYPELYSHLSDKITNEMVKSQLDEEKPTYRTRQAMALFLGRPLDSTMTPMSIQAAQATYLSQQPPPQPGMAQGKTKKGTSTLGKSNKSYQTASQAAESDTTAREH